MAARSQYGMLNDGVRFHVMTHLIQETVNCGKSMLATSIVSREDPSDSGSNPKETGTIQNLIQKDRVLGAVRRTVTSNVFVFNTSCQLGLHICLFLSITVFCSFQPGVNCFWVRSMFKNKLLIEHGEGNL